MRSSSHFRFFRPAVWGAALCALSVAGCSVGEHNASAGKANTDLKVPSLGEWFSQAWQRYNTPFKPPAPVVASPRVFDNRNATRPTAHPAWQLANILNGDAPLQFSISAADIFQIAAQNRIPSSAARIGDVSALSPLRNATTSTGNFAGAVNNGSDARALARWQLGTLDARTAFADELPALQNQIETRQLNAVETLLAQSLAAQNKANTNIARSLEAALQDDIALARQLNPGALEPYLPSELQALALSNLRLDLLPALDKSPTQADASNEERVRRDIAIRAALREQELARRDALKRLREDLPIQLEAAKRQELQKTLAAQSARDQQLRAQAQSEARALIAQDFGTADARLGIVLPAQSARTPLNVEKPFHNLNRTGNGSGASFGAGEIRISSTRADATNNAAQRALKTHSENAVVTNGQVQTGAPITILKTLARHDARQWERITARRDRAWQTQIKSKSAKTPTAKN